MFQIKSIISYLPFFNEVNAMISVLQVEATWRHLCVFDGDNMKERFDKNKGGTNKMNTLVYVVVVVVLDPRRTL